MRLARAMSGTVGAALALTALLSPAAEASSAETGVSAGAADGYDCVVVASRISANQPEANLGPVLCGTSPARTAATDAASFVLIAFYEHAKFNTTRRGRSTAILVESPCDSVGYRMSDLRDANNKVGGVSSYTYGTAGCNDGQLFFNTNFTGTSTFVRGDCPNVGTSFNDHLWSMRVWRYPCGC